MWSISTLWYTFIAKYLNTFFIAVKNNSIDIKKRITVMCDLIKDNGLTNLCII